MFVCFQVCMSSASMSWSSMVEGGARWSMGTLRTCGMAQCDKEIHQVCSNEFILISTFIERRS